MRWPRSPLSPVVVLRSCAVIAPSIAMLHQAYSIAGFAVSPVSLALRQGPLGCPTAQAGSPGAGPPCDGAHGCALRALAGEAPRVCELAFLCFDDDVQRELVILDRLREGHACAVERDARL